VRRVAILPKLAALAALAGCGTFENPNVVVDLRILSMTATPPEQVVDVDITKPAVPADLLTQLVPAEVCALIADPNFDRRLRWTMTMCNLSSGRCSGNQKQIGSGIVEDPDLSPIEPKLCAPIPVDGNLLGIIIDTFNNDSLHGLAGIDYGVSLRIGGETADPDLDQYAEKRLRVTPRVPKERTANHNPSLTGIDASIDGVSQPLWFGRCLDQVGPLPWPLVVAPEQVVRLAPIEAPDAREVYVVPTLDGSSRSFTESLKYQWIIGGGKLSKGDTGGPHDPFGNPAPLFTDWTAPKASDLDGPTDVSFWIIQRDERLGEQWYETCIRVVP
jgi:hypothetical protein